MAGEEDIYKDDFLKKHLKDVQLKEPSEQFTNKVMDKVMQQWLTKSVVKKKSIPRKSWFWLGITVAVLILILLITDVRTIIQTLNLPIFNRIDVIYLQPIHDTFVQLIHNLVNMPVLIYIALVVIAFLSLLDFYLKTAMSRER